MVWGSGLICPHVLLVPDKQQLEPRVWSRGHRSAFFRFNFLVIMIIGDTVTPLLWCMRSKWVKENSINSSLKRCYW